MSSGSPIADEVLARLRAQMLDFATPDDSSTPAVGGGAPTSGGKPFDPEGQTQTDAFKAYRRGEWMRNSVGGSKPFTASEISRGYRKLG